MKQGFNNAFYLLDGFVFEDWLSRENALWAAYWAQTKKRGRGASMKPPMVIIMGPAESGKTELMNRLTDGFPVCCPLNDKHELMEHLTCAVATKQAIVAFDNVSPRVLNMETMLAFLTARNWSYRPCGTSRLEEGEANQLIIATMADGEVSPDLQRRSIVIRLASRRGNRIFVDLSTAAIKPVIRRKKAVGGGASTAAKRRKR